MKKRRTILNAHATGARMKSLMRKQGLTAKDVSSILGVSPQAVSRWLNGQSFPTHLNMYKLSLLLETPVLAILVPYKSIEI